MARHDIVSPCPQDIYYPDKIGFYVLRLDMAKPRSYPVASGELLYLPNQVPDTLDRPNDPIVDLAKQRLGFPSVVSLHSRSANVVRLKNLSPAEENQLNALGFMRRRELLAMDSRAGRTYLTFDFPDSGLDVACPGLNLKHHCVESPGYTAIWDAEHFRILIPHPDFGQDYCTSFKVWNYRDDTYQTINFRYVPAGGISLERLTP